MIKAEVIFDGNEITVYGRKWVFTIEKIEPVDGLVLYLCCVNGQKVNEDPMLTIEDAIRFCVEN